jgi:hypothetical protein
MLRIALILAMALLGCRDADPIKRGVDEKRRIERDKIDELRRAQQARERQVRRRRTAAVDGGVADAE